jgi:hypothetical protein
MGGMNIYIVLALGLPSMPNPVKDRIGIKALSGYIGATVDKSLMDKDLGVFGGSKYRQIRHSFTHF